MGIMKKPEKPTFEPTPRDSLMTIMELTRSGMECADGLLAELEGIQNMARELLQELAD